MGERVHHSLSVATNWLHLGLCKPALCHLCEYSSGWGQLQALRLKGGSFLTRKKKTKNADQTLSFECPNFLLHA